MLSSSPTYPPPSFPLPLTQSLPSPHTHPLPSPHTHPPPSRRHLVGLLANDGELSAAAAIKGTHFIRMCTLRGIPLVFLQNTPSDAQFLSETGNDGATVKSRAQMMATLACSTVPKITVVVGGSYGPSSYAMVCVHTPFSPNTLYISLPPSSVGEQCSLTFSLAGHMQEWVWLNLNIFWRHSRHRYKCGWLQSIKPLTFLEGESSLVPRPCEFRTASNKHAEPGNEARVRDGLAWFVPDITTIYGRV